VAGSVRRELLELLVDPVDSGSLRLEAHAPEGDEVLDGSLIGSSNTYPIRNGIPRFVLTRDAGQRQTSSSFAFKWKHRSAYDSIGVYETFRPWLLQRYGFNDVEHMRTFFSSHERVLDAGCGSGFSSSLWLTAQNPIQWIGVDISEAIDVARERLAGIPNTHFVQADILRLPFRRQTFDAIFSEGVLHHTPSTENALKSLVPFLAAGGEFLFYVYRKKGPIREFADDYIRQMISSLPPEEARKRLYPLTRLGQALAKLKAEVDIPEEIELLGIKAGRYDVQRLIYWHFIKCFWNEKMTLEENNHVNFDWYHPRYAHRQTEDQVKTWCAEAGLSIVHFDAQESGFTVRAVKS